jgi:Ribonuclease G/E
MNIRELVTEGQELVVQVEKEERGNKGAALTTFISLAGRFLVLMPNNPRAGGVSRRIEGEDRDQMREVMSQLQVPTAWAPSSAPPASAARPRSCSGTWITSRRSGKRSMRPAKGRGAPFLVFQESDAVTRALRDYLTDDIGEILVDDPAPSRRPRNTCSASCRPTRSASSSLYRRHPAVHALPDREPDRVGLRAQGAAALGRQPRDRLHRGAGVDRHQLGARHARRRHRDHGAATPTSKRPRKSPASCAFATSAA